MRIPGEVEHFAVRERRIHSLLIKSIEKSHLNRLKFCRDNVENELSFYGPGFRCSSSVSSSSSRRDSQRMIVVQLDEDSGSELLMVSRDQWQCRDAACSSSSSSMLVLLT